MDGCGHFEDTGDAESVVWASIAISSFIPAPVNQLKTGRVCQRSEEGRQILYADERYICSSNMGVTTAVVVQRRRLLARISRAGRLVMLHAGNRASFIPNAQLIFKANQKTRDYHSEMNSENYIRCPKERLTPNLEPNSLLVTDNAS
jgi:hypothetical protein